MSRYLDILHNKTYSIYYDIIEHLVKLDTNIHARYKDTRVIRNIHYNIH